MRHARRKRISGLVRELDRRLGDKLRNARPRRRDRRRPRSARYATARYIAPVSRYWKPRRVATPLATVDLPEPAGPSMAMIMSLFESTFARGIRRPHGTTQHRSAPAAGATASAATEACEIVGEHRIAHVDGLETPDADRPSRPPAPRPPRSWRAGGRRASRGWPRAAARDRGRRASPLRPRRSRRAPQVRPRSPRSRSDSLTRSSPTPSNRVSPCACEATSASIGISSTSDGTSSAVTVVADRGARCTGVDLADTLALGLGERHDVDVTRPCARAPAGIPCGSG